ncbi:hypothetical protein XELAEV_18017217mg [Xenopus laevis]|uniref:Uncharacterized protein n=1 Tax=Xenopus laevis TaxID=8355 RepID=A0A974DB74_XENLA|nr:hypothetical protein XELAEV_18017217mg [Xenopus laevis]
MVERQVPVVLQSGHVVRQLPGTTKDFWKAPNFRSIGLLYKLVKNRSVLHFYKLRIGRLMAKQSFCIWKT